MKKVRDEKNFEKRRYSPLSVANSIKRAIKVSRATLRELNNVSKGGGSRKRVLLRSIRERCFGDEKFGPPRDSSDPQQQTTLFSEEESPRSLSSTLD